jgi:hypothetical protein
MAQMERVLSHLKTKGTIQPLEAWRDLGIYRLSAVIFDLRQEGHKIDTKRIEMVNRFGEPALIAEYSLEVEKCENTLL